MMTGARPSIYRDLRVDCALLMRINRGGVVVGELHAEVGARVVRLNKKMSKHTNLAEHKRGRSTQTYMHREFIASECVSFEQCRGHCQQ